MENGDDQAQPKNELVAADLAYVVTRLTEFYTNDGIHAWLYARHPQLGGERAMDLVHERRAVEVLNVINRLDSEVNL